MCDIIESRLPLKKRRFLNVVSDDRPLDFSLPSRERAKLEIRYRACSSSPCSSKSSMVSDLEMDEDQRVPSNPTPKSRLLPNNSSPPPPQTMPIDLSVKPQRNRCREVNPSPKTRTTTTTPTTTTSTLKAANTTTQRQLTMLVPSLPSLLLSYLNVPSSVDLFGVYSLLDRNARCVPSNFTGTILVRQANNDGSEIEYEQQEVAESGDGNNNGYVINPTTGNRCKKNYKNVTVEKRCEANARERTRVQTIAATFEELRGLLPCAGDMKLSKLAILRIASKYVQYLGALIGKDYSGKGYGVQKCLSILLETVESESHLKR